MAQLLGVVDGLDAVMNDRDPCLLHDLPPLDDRLMKRAVVGLPLERGLAGVDRWGDLLVAGAGEEVGQGRAHDAGRHAQCLPIRGLAALLHLVQVLGVLHQHLPLGIGHRLSDYDRIQAFTVFDVRLHTGQQNTHVTYRHKINRNNGITFDGVFKSGHIDSGKYIHAAGIGAYYDRPKWFWKIYFDPYVNYTSHTMLRTGIGLKF